MCVDGADNTIELAPAMNLIKTYCTSDPAMWETNEIGAQDILDTDTQKTRSDNQGYKGARGRLGGGKEEREEEH